MKFPIKFSSFSQRKFLGFRNKFEFDKKRLIIASNQQFTVIGYDLQKRVYELYQMQFSQDEQIQFIHFLEDYHPAYIFMAIYNQRDKRSIFKILKLKKNRQYQQKIEESKSFFTERIIINLNQGNFKKKKKKSYDNLELIPTRALDFSEEKDDLLYYQSLQKNRINSTQFEEQKHLDVPFLKILQNNIIKNQTISDFIVNDYPFLVEEYGTLNLDECILKSFLFNRSSGTYIFTIEKNKIISMYVIKSFDSQSRDLISSIQKITNFKMAKRVQMVLEFQPKQIELFCDHFVVIYKYKYNNNDIINLVPFIDIFEKYGRPISRINLKDIMDEYDLILVSIKRIKYPKLQWSNRTIEELELSKFSSLKRAIVVGECIYSENIRPFILKINLENQAVDIIKILNTEDKISQINFGPYDNGYILIGMKSGQLLVFDPLNLEKIQTINLFNSAVKTITFEPTNQIIIGSVKGDLMAFSIINSEMSYVYLDLGKKQYCTVTLPKIKQSEQDLLYPSNSYHFDNNTQNFCCL